VLRARLSRHDGLHLCASRDIVAERYKHPSAVRQQLNELDRVSEVEVVYLVRFDPVDGRKRSGASK